MNEKTTIGNAEYVWLVDAGISKVPARIDTGARTSAVWASDIVETEDGLTFRLFGKDSAFYTADAHTERRYTKVAVSSSSGHVQIRYRIPMTIQIRGRRVKSYCTLADRSSQAYPLLIGRNTLRGKFIVDVQKGSSTLKKLDDQKVKELRLSIDTDKGVI